VDQVVGKCVGYAHGAADPNDIRKAGHRGHRVGRPVLEVGNGKLVWGNQKHAVEAELARRGFESLSDANRAALLAFLGSL
jgi:hypothetical protein